MHPWKIEVDRFCRQYLQLEPNIDFPQDAYIRLADAQNAIYTNLFADGAIEFAPTKRYQLRVLKQLVSRIETSIEDWEEHGVSDDLMLALSVLIAKPLPAEAESVQQKCYVTYYLSALGSAHDSLDSSDITDAVVRPPYITLLENRDLIAAAGTTGLRTWEAALHLGQFLCVNPSIIKGKRILELGAGTGYLSILCAIYLAAEHVIASDGSDDVILNLPENFYLNRLQGANCINAMDVKWGHALLGTEEQQWNGGRRVDVVIGADITYDAGLNSALVGTLVDVFELNQGVEVYLAATQRNEDTFGSFLNICEKNGLAVKDLQFKVPPQEAQNAPFYNDQVAIRICCVSKP